ncbi:sensor histidine kinase [Chloroflexota bacterium]
MNDEEIINIINSRLALKGTERSLGSEQEVIVFRIVQEALNNVRRHSQATKVLVTIEFLSESIKIDVKDDGKGFILNKTVVNLAADGKLGIMGMQQRAKLLNGVIDIQSQCGKGTLVSIEIVDQPV